MSIYILCILSFWSIHIVRSHPWDIRIVHIVLLAVFTIIADMFLHFEYMAVFFTIIPTIFGEFSGTAPDYEIAVTRVLSVLIPVGLYILLDFVIMPRRMSGTVGILLNRSAELNNEINEELSKDEVAYKIIEKHLDEKQEVNETLRTLNSYMKNDTITGVLSKEHEISHRLILMIFDEEESELALGRYDELRRTNLISDLNESNRLSAAVMDFMDKKEEAYAK